MRMPAIGPTAWRFTKFTVVGAIGIAVQALALALLLQVAGQHYLVATVLAVETAVLHNFLWHTRWTWADRRGSGTALTFFRFNATNGAMSLIGNVVAMCFLVGVLNLNPQIANLAAIGACALVNYALADKVVFV
jgi:putative flippase GtrA